jgi:preprotein translocase subunit SecG
MTCLPLLAVGILMKFVAFLFVVVCLVLILVILVQKGRGGGLSGAFGGGMASGLLGSKTGDFLTWVTIGLVAVFLGLAVLMARFYRPSVRYGTEAPAPTGQSAPATTQQAAPAPAEQPAPTTDAPAAQPQPAQPDATGAGAAQPSQGADAGATGGQ